MLHQQNWVSLNKDWALHSAGGGTALQLELLCNWSSFEGQSNPQHFPRHPKYFECRTRPFFKTSSLSVFLRCKVSRCDRSHRHMQSCRIPKIGGFPSGVAKLLDAFMENPNKKWMRTGGTLTGGRWQLLGFAHFPSWNCGN